MPWMHYRWTHTLYHCKLIKCPLAGRGSARSVSQFGVPIPFRVPAGAQIYDSLVPRRAHCSRGETGAASRLGEEGACVFDTLRRGQLERGHVRF